MAGGPARGDEASLLAAERALQKAQLASDVDALDLLLHDDLELFIGPDTGLHGKAEDLQAHRDHIFSFRKSEEIEVSTSVFGTTGVTSALLELELEVGGAPVAGRYRYLRAWSFEEGRWQIVGGAVVTVPS